MREKYCLQVTKYDADDRTLQTEIKTSIIITLTQCCEKIKKALRSRSPLRCKDVTFFVKEVKKTCNLLLKF